MFKLQIMHHCPIQRLSPQAHAAVIAESEHQNALLEHRNLYYFVLFSADGDAGVTVLQGVIVNFKIDVENNHIPRDNRFILDSLQLQGTAMDLDNMPERLAQFIRHWQRETVLTYGDLLIEFVDLAENTHAIVPRDAVKP